MFDARIMAKERQDALYVLLLSQAPDEWISLRRVATEMSGYYPNATLTNFHNSATRRWITRDIEAINADPEYEKIIISGNYGIKLATADEFDFFIKGELAEIFRKLKRARQLMRKGNADQQMDLEGRARQTFLGGD